MGLTGDLQKLNAMAADMKRLPLSIKNRVAVAMTATTNELLEEQFTSGIGPDGEPWEPLADSTIQRGRSNPPLGGTSVERDVHAVRVGTNVVIEGSEVAGYHQRGHHSPTRLPKRPMWPEGELPDRYDTALSLAGNQAILEAIGATSLAAAE